MKHFLNCCNLQSGIFKVNKHQFSLGQKATFIFQFQLHKMHEYLTTYLAVVSNLSFEVYADLPATGG